MFRDLFRSQGYTNNHSSLDWDWNRLDGAAGAPAGGVAGEALGNGGMLEGDRPYR